MFPGVGGAIESIIPPAPGMTVTPLPYGLKPRKTNHNRGNRRTRGNAAQHPREELTATNDQTRRPTGRHIGPDGAYQAEHVNHPGDDAAARSSFTTDPIGDREPMYTPRLDARRVDDFTQYLVALERSVVRILRGRGHRFAEDVAVDCVIKVLEKGSSIMDRYPSARVLATAMAVRASVSWDRSERVQRGEGAALDRDADGIIGPRRHGISLDLPVGDEDNGATFGDLLPGSDDFVDELLDEIEVNDEILRLLEGLPARDRELLWLRFAEGLTVVAIAAQDGRARETIQRRLKVLVDEIRANLPIPPV